MKKGLLFILVAQLCVCPMMVFGQLEVKTNGDTYVGKNIYLESASNFLGTISDVPITFKVNNILAGATGSSGNANVAFGFGALSNNSGSNNTANGYYALRYNTTGSNNTAIGYYAGVIFNNLNNVTSIGYDACVTASNQVRIGNINVTSIGGYVGWSNISDGRIKKNIQTNVPGLDFINRLQPVTYNLNLDAVDDLLKSDDPKINRFRDSLRAAQTPEEKKIIAEARANKEKQVYTGFIAQDVEKTAKSIGYDFSGVDAPENSKGAYGLRYAEFVVPLVKAVQELSEQVNELKAEIDELKKSNNVGVMLKSAKLAQQGDDIFIQQNEDSAVLYQNTPNPFSQSTEIKYYLPASVKVASLCIYDLYGKQLKQIRLSERGNGSQIISGSELSAGIYLYALIANDKEIDVKRMILTE